MYSSGWKLGWMSHFVIVTKNLWVLQMDVLISRIIWTIRTVKKYTIPWSYNLWWIWLWQKRCYSWNTLTLISTNLCHLVLTSYNNTYLKYNCHFSPSETQQWVQKVSIACWCHLHLTLQFKTLTIIPNWNNFQWITERFLSKSSLFLEPFHCYGWNKFF